MSLNMADSESEGYVDREFGTEGQSSANDLENLSNDREEEFISRRIPPYSLEPITLDESEPIIDLTDTPAHEIVDLTVKTPRKCSDDVIEVTYLDDASSSTQHKEESSTPNMDLQCCVCMQETSEFSTAGKHTVSTLCGHIFCSDCIERILVEFKQCAVCKKKITSRKHFHKIFI